MKHIKTIIQICLVFTALIICGASSKSFGAQAYEKKSGVNINKVKNEINGIHIFWEKMDDADGYSIYRKKATDKSFSYLKIVSKESYDFLDEKVDNNTIYSYKVCSFKYINGQRFFGYFGNTVSSCLINSPNDVNIYPDNEGMKITWDKVYGVNGYSIYRKSQNEDNYKYIKLITLNTDSYYDKDVENGIAYSYKIYSYISYYGKRFFSGSSDASASRPYINTPVITSLKKENNSLLLKWNKIEGADGYSVYRKKRGDVAFTYQRTVNYENYIDSAVNCNEQYSYKVCAYTSNNGKRFFGCFSNPTQYKSVDSTRHMLTIIDDDGCNSFYNKMLPIIEKKNISISTAIETGNVGTADYMSWERIKECYNKGAEVLNHSRDHIYSKEANESRTYDEIKEEMLASMEMLNQHGYSETSNIYVYPGAAAGRTWSVAKDVFRVGINSSGSETNIWPLKNRYNIHRYPIGSRKIPTYEEMKGYVDELSIIDNGWQVWMLHSNNGNITNGAIEDICRIIDYCNEVNVEIVSAKEALDYYDLVNFTN